MGLGPTATVGFADADGNWVPVSPDTPLPISGGGGGGGTWGSITGTLSNQTDLQAALDGKVDSDAGGPVVDNASTGFTILSPSGNVYFFRAVDTGSGNWAVTLSAEGAGGQMILGAPGGIMAVNPISLTSAPTLDAHATTKKYVDDTVDAIFPITDVGDSGFNTQITGGNVNIAAGESQGVSISGDSISLAGNSGIMFHGAWANFAMLEQGIVLGSGVTAFRPNSPTSGAIYIDTTLGKIIWYDAENTTWRDAMGTAV